MNQSNSNSYIPGPVTPALKLVLLAPPAQVLEALESPLSQGPL